MFTAAVVVIAVDQAASQRVDVVSFNAISSRCRVRVPVGMGRSVVRVLMDVVMPAVGFGLGLPA